MAALVLNGAHEKEEEEKYLNAKSDTIEANSRSWLGLHV